MKPVYGDIILRPGCLTGGIFSILVIPKEFITSVPAIDFSTGTITTPLTLAAGQAWYEITFAPNTYTYDETPKTARQGSYFEITVKGVVNDITPPLQQLINTLRYHELVCQVIDREKNIKLCGDINRGMVLQYNPLNTNSGGASKTIPIILTIQSEDPAPFYNV